MVRNREGFSRRLQELRTKKQISRTVLSELCGLNSDAVRRYENGSDEPKMSALISLAEYFEVTVDYLIARE